MDEEAFNMSLRKFLKKLGVTSQREIELAVRERLDAGDLDGSSPLDIEAVVRVPGVAEEIRITGTLKLS